tara:strand:+ start:1063 stop:1350 length:288 start_codon:yes stop_codon:yes gene_type:complete
MTVKSTIKELITLSESPGWEILHKTMQDEILQLALNMARSSEMTQQHMDFQRGAIFAAEQMLSLPTKLINKFEGELSLDEATSRQGRSERTNNGH